MKIEFPIQDKPTNRDTFETSFVTRATIELLANNEIGEIEIYLEMKCDNSDCFRIDMWIGEVNENNIKINDIPDDVKQTIEVYILSLED